MKEFRHHGLCRRTRKDYETLYLQIREEIYPKKKGISEMTWEDIVKKDKDYSYANRERKFRYDGPGGVSVLMQKIWISSIVQMKTEKMQ